MIKRTHKLIHVILAALLAAILAVTAVLIWRLLTPVKAEFIPPEFDPQAVVGAPQVTDHTMQYTQLDIAGSYTVLLCGSCVIDSGQLQMYFTSPVENTVWLKLRILEEDGTVLGESGLVRPGEYLESVALDRLPKRRDTLTVKVISYEPDTYYSAGSANIKVNIRTLE